MTIGNNRSPNQVFGPAAPDDPDFGDPGILPKGIVRRPSHERMPFGPSGALKPDGPGPYPADFLGADDLEGLPWTRTRGNAWTSQEFRTLVLRWLREYLRDRPAIVRWDITERAMGTRTALRMPPDQHYLVFGVTKALGRQRSVRVEIAVAFPVAIRGDAVETRRVLALVEDGLDLQLG